MIGLLLVVAIASLISSFLDPGFGFNLASLATYIGFMVALVVILVAFEVPGLIVHRRRYGEWGRLRALPWAVAIAAVFVLVSRVATLEPGYLYGVVIGTIWLREASDADEGRQEAAGAILALLLAVGSWLALSWVRDAGLPVGAFGTIVAETALAAIVVAGLEGMAFGLMPFRFLPGRAIYRWSRPIWALLFFAAVVAFELILIGPNSGYLNELKPEAWLAAMGVFAAFGAFSVAFWAYFRFRPSRKEAAEA